MCRPPKTTVVFPLVVVLVVPTIEKAVDLISAIGVKIVRPNRHAITVSPRYIHTALPHDIRCITMVCWIKVVVVLPDEKVVQLAKCEN